MSAAQAKRTWTIGNERVRADVDAEGNLVITNMERRTPYQPGKRFAVTDSIVISAAFVPDLCEALASLLIPVDCRVCTGEARADHWPGGEKHTCNKDPKNSVHPSGGYAHMGCRCAGCAT